MAIQLKNKADAPKAGTIMLVGITILYMVSLGLAVSMSRTNRLMNKKVHLLQP